MGGAERHPGTSDVDSRAHSRALNPTRRAFDLRFAQTVREIAATAELVAVTAEHLSHDAENVAGVRAERLRYRADAERREARRLWELANEMEA